MVIYHLGRGGNYSLVCLCNIYSEVKFRNTSRSYSNNHHPTTLLQIYGVVHYNFKRYIEMISSQTNEQKYDFGSCVTASRQRERERERENKLK